MVEAAETYLWPVYGHTSLSRGWSNSHDGLDISDSTVAGATVRATKSGTVVRVFTGCNNYNGMTTGNCQGKGKCSPNNGYWNGLCNYGFGNGVIIQHNDGGYSSYAHMGSVSVSVGNSVSRGQPIGTVGSTGNSSGPHLHFSLNTAILGSGYNNNKDVISYDYGGNDSQPPTIANAKISDITKDGYTVTCNISDNVGVSRVEFPTWTPDNNGQDDLIWHQGVINGNTASYRVKISEHNNETRCTYVTHIYAWDAAGNSSNVSAGSVYIGDETPPTISNVKVSDISADGYTVTCNVSDNIGVAKVEFPTWTPDNNGQDDLIWHQGTINGNTASYRVKISEHNNETKCTYVTHIYAWDAAGNVSNVGAVSVYMGDETPPAISNVKVTDINEDGYTITCDVSDNIAVSRVEFPTWTAKDGQDDIIWHNGIINGNTASYIVNISQHGNERDLYYTHIYAYDYTGNYKKVVIEPVLINWTTRNSIVFDGHYYSIYTFNGDYDWNSAKTFCEKLGGHLATITSVEENKAVLDLLLKANKDAWIGATDKNEEGNWKWVNGEPFSYSNWAASQPDNYNGEQHYSVMWKDGTWDDGALFCGINSFIFEYDKPYIINISNAEITDIDDTGYTVSCTVDSEFPLKNVSFPTWTPLSGQDDIIWYDAEINGNTASYRVNTSEHNNESGLYVTHIYAYDTYGNCYSDTPINRKMHTIIGNPKPSNTVEYNGHRYELYELGGEYEWGYAKYFCEEKGGHLATITSVEEDNIIYQLVKDFQNHYWLGGTDRDNEGEWKWITGEAFNYTNWNESQPDNYENEDYLCMYNYNGKWNDYNGNLFGFICEYESEPALNASLENKETYTTIKVQPQFIETGNSIVIAVYKYKKLVDLQIRQYEGKDIETTTIPDYEEIKVMLWSNIQSMEPLCPASVFKIE
jgi:hypothetical protein